MASPQSTTVEPEPLLTVSDVARLLSVKASWVYAQVEDPKSKLPFVRVGRYVRFESAAIAAYITGNRRGA
jgi:excisionase family DNA binding protein